MRIQHKAAADAENFPVASFLLPAPARKKVLALYDFVRGADNISDDPDLSPEAKQTQLEGLQHADAAEQAPGWALAYLRLVKADAVNPQHANALLAAFLQDTRKNRYANMQELEGYCQLSANPVGRYVLEACGEDKADLQASDAICSVLQILNHIQDIRSDYLQRERIYLPQDRMTHYGVTDAMLAQDTESPQLRALKVELLGWCTQQLTHAQPLFASIRHFRVRLEIRWIWNMAHRLCSLLHEQDVMHSHVKPTKAMMLWACAVALKDTCKIRGSNG